MIFGGGYMQADYIQDIVGKVGNLPYKCIMFDGPWGIGKTYAIEEAIKKQRSVCRVSLFGLQNSQQIYHEVLFQSTLKNSKAGKLGEFASDMLTGLGNIWEGAAPAKEVLKSVAREKELFGLLSKSFKDLHIIVIDDLERISSKVSMEEVLGIIEDLKKCDYVRLILVANTKELEGENKAIFEKYNEKVIDKIYYISERPEKINWGDLGIHAGFMKEFLSIHKVKNLRTLQKAQKFFDEVKMYCEDIDNEEFLAEVRLICFAIVVEDTDNLYYKELSETEKNNNQIAYAQMRNLLNHRILNYLSNIRCGRNFVDTLLQYYKNECIISKEDVQVAFSLFIKAGKKSNYYKTDDEIKRLLPSLYECIKTANTLSELNKYADEYAEWCTILEEDSSSVLEEYRQILKEMLSEEVLRGNEEILTYESVSWRLSSESVLKIYRDVNGEVRHVLIKNYVDYLTETTKGVKSYEYSYKLRGYWGNTHYRTIIKELVDNLYNDNSFPIGESNEAHYSTCYNIMRVLYEVDNEKFLAYCEDLVKRCDRMSNYRIKQLVEEIEKG